MELRIGRYLSGEAGAEESVALERDLETDATLKENFLVYQKIWKNAQVESGMSWNSEAAYHRFVLNTNQDVPVRSKTHVRRLSWAVAAALVLALGAAVFFWNAGKPITYAYNELNSAPILLSDGSRIYLNEKASVTVYPFKRKERRVELTGEAYFEVKPDAIKPFVVEAGKSITEVVGTAFNLKQAEGSTSIFVSQGKVIFSSESNESEAIALTSGEAAIIEESKIQRIANPSANVLSWYSRQLSFVRETPIEEVIAIVSTYFSQEIVIENNFAKACRFTSPLPFKEPKIESVLNAVVISLNAELVKEGNKYIIRGGRNCD